MGAAVESLSEEERKSQQRNTGREETKRHEGHLNGRPTLLDGRTVLSKIALVDRSVFQVQRPRWCC